MRRYFCLLALTILQGHGPENTLLGQTVKPAPSFGISGIVVNARDNSPVRHCHLNANLIAGGRGPSHEPVYADTDERGHFSLNLPSAGDWQLTANAHNIRVQHFDEHEGYFSGVVLTAATPMYDLVFRAVPDAVLSGVVTDEAGDPVRSAQVALYRILPPTGSVRSGPRQQSGSQTDDRGQYEFASLEPGNYLVQVQARPWYAAGANGLPRSPAPAASAVSPDPSLDVVYPMMWYPGVTDSSAATTLTAHAGDALRADFRLIPEASSRLLIASHEPQPASPTASSGPMAPPEGLRVNPSIAMVLPNGTTQPVFGQYLRDQAGNVEIGGLAPGTYQVTIPGTGPDTPARTSVIHIQSAGSTMKLADALPGTDVIVTVDGGTRVNAAGILLRALATGEVFSDSFRDDLRGGPLGMPGGQPARGLAGVRQAPPPRAGTSRGRGRDRSPGEENKVRLQVPPGRYEVELAADSSAFITGLSAKGIPITGRVLTIADAPVQLTVHLASGLATVDGFATSAARPAQGAMVLLVPATFGDPASLSVVRRDQTNTDGSFHLDRVVPGPYILVAIDHGWGVHWSDPETLRPYLMQGIPLDLRPGVSVSPRVNATNP